jgi:phosphatidyl-myo-inositol dimannoside synthase
VPRKGQDRLIAAWPAVLRRIPDARLVIVGQGPDLSRLSALAANLSLADRIVFTGAVSYAELPAHHRLGTVMAMPCRSRRRGWDVEGLGIVFLEAQACGVPVVVGRSGGAPDAVLDGQTGRVVAPNDVAGLAATLVELLGDPVAARSMGEAGRRWMLEQWTLPTVAAQLREILVG